MSAVSDDEQTVTGPATPSDNRAGATRDKPQVQDEDDEDEDDEDEDDEPQLKYHRLTGHLTSVYRNGDDTSSFLVAGDKMVIGTHNGNIHVLSVPSLEPLRTYHAHSASVTSLSISPIPPYPVLGAPVPLAPRPSTDADNDSARSPSGKQATPNSKSTPRKQVVPNIPSNQIHIASASVDGHVCVSSLVDATDVTLRNFARPVQAVALSPEYKYDRTYLSGGLAGNLILTVGGKVGVSADANTNSAAAAAQGWLGSIGLGGNTGKDTILHSGEGSIAAIKFSKTNKFVAWINEHGIKIMRSHMKLDSAELQYAWKRIAHIDRPRREVWEDMAAVWKGRLEWVNDSRVEADTPSQTSNGRPAPAISKKRPEKLVVGWGDTAWVLHVHVGGVGTGRHAGERSMGKADIAHKFTFDDCILSGLALYTPSLLAVLAYRSRDDNDKEIDATSHKTQKRRRNNALSPELRLISIASGEEVDVDTLTVSRYESLGVTDYHLATVFISPPIVTELPQRGALESINAGFWDMSNNATRMFSSGASVRSATASGENGVGAFRSPAPSVVNARGAGIARLPPPEAPPGLNTAGLKMFIQTPYDCVLAMKRDPSDHLAWLLEHHKYGPAWEYLDLHPAIFKPSMERVPESDPGTPTKTKGSLADFFADDSASQTTISANNNSQSTAVVREKERIGDLWLQQLIAAKHWKRAGEVAGQVLGTSARWEHWVLAFAHADHFDEIAPFIPSTDVHPPLPSFVYEVVLGHYIADDPPRFQELLDKWDPDLFDITSVATAIESRLRSGDVTQEGETESDWRILMSGLAKLNLAGGHAREGLSCYIKLQDAETALSIIRDYHLTDAIADDVPGFVSLRVSREQLSSGSVTELQEASNDVIDLLVEEAYNGIVQPQTVVKQLLAKGATFRPFIYFYFARLWRGPNVDEDRIISRVERLNMERLTTEGRIIVEQFADLAMNLFVQYDRDLFSLYLRTSNAYTLDTATQLCEEKSVMPELVYLLSKTGQTKKALFLIIEKLQDVSQAISFTKEHPDLWDDLLEYSMDKPRFIQALLGQAGTAVDAVDLVRRIPEGLEIEGLKEGVQRMVKEYDIQFSISEGVAKVLRGEVAAGLERLREGRRRGVKFEVNRADADGDEKVEVAVDPLASAVDGPPEAAALADKKPGYCVVCVELFDENEQDFLVGFACGHVFHLECLVKRTNATHQARALIDSLKEESAVDGLEDGDGDGPEQSLYTHRSVGEKVAHAQVIRSAIGGAGGGCVECAGRGEEGG